MRVAIRALDNYLRRKTEIVEFSQDPDCLFRVRFTKAYRDLVLPDITVEKGEPVAEIHWWNEHIPPVSADGLDLRWAVAMRRKLIVTHQEMAQQVLDNPAWQACSAVGTTTALFPAADDTWVRKMQRLGYIVLPHNNPAGRLREFFEAVWAWLLWKTYQSGTLRVLSPFAISRSDFWMSTANMVRMYGNNSRRGR